MRSFVWAFSIIALSHHRFGNPLPLDFPLESDFISDDAVIFNDVEASNSNSVPVVDLTAQTPDFSDPTSMQSLDTSWLTDFSAFSPDTTQLFSDSFNTPFETSLFSEPSGALLESSCGGGADGNSQSLSKRIESGICTDKAEADPLPLKIPDMKDLENIFGAGIEKQPSGRTFPIPPTPGYTVDDDRMCGKPRRRLCCQGPFGTGATIGLVANCRDFGPWTCPARYDVCCERYIGLNVPSLNIVTGNGLGCVVLSENPNPVDWS